jgi:hypothetical protein
MDRISEIVERAISVADLVRENDPKNFETAETSLTKLAEELRVSAPDHPALKRLEEYIRQIKS